MIKEQKGRSLITDHQGHKSVTYCKLYNTVVAVITSTGKMTKISLNSGGWITQSTQKAIKAAFQSAELNGIYISRKKGEFIVDVENPITGKKDKHKFIDRLELVLS